MENVNRWYFTKDQLANTPSRKSGITASRELHYRQQAANFIQDMGQRLQVSQLCINTAIVYMHRFYVFHSFVDVHRNSLSVAALFLAAKVEEQPRKLEHVIKVAHACLHKDSPPLDVKTPAYAEKQLEVVVHENVLLQTLGFVLAIEHPHTYVVKVCQLVKASKDLAQTSYFMATTSLHMTTMCLQYKPTVVACVCIHLACKWSSWKIEPCSEGKEWYYYVDKSVNMDLLETLTQEFIAILETSPHKFKRFAPKDGGSSHSQRSAPEESAKHSVDTKVALIKKAVFSPVPSTSASVSASQLEEKPVVKHENSEKPTNMPPLLKQSSPSIKNKVASTHSISLDVYREKKEKERLELKNVASLPPTELPAQPPVVKSHPVTNEPERAGKSAPKPAEQHPHVKDRGVKTLKEHQVHSTSNNKMNHQLPKVNSDVTYPVDTKHNELKLPSTSSSDPVVVLERMDVHSGTLESGEIVSPTQNVMDSVNVKNTYQAENECEAAVPVVAPHSPAVVVHTKSKHQKHRTNSVHNSHASAQQIPHKRSPVKDVKTNGSKTEVTERNVVENSIKNTEVPVKHEKREKHKSKHSSSSKEKAISNNTEHSNPSIKVKIRKDIICLPEISHAPSVAEGQKKLKIKLPKPPPAAQPETPIKLVITKDKSGSGSYSTSHKNERGSKKRSHSPQGQSKGAGETPSKYAKMEHSHANTKQNKVARNSSSRNMDHAANDIGSLHSESDSCHGIDGGQTYYANNQYYPSQGMNQSVRSKTHPPLPPPLPPQPPPPPPQ